MRWMLILGFILPAVAWADVSGPSGKVIDCYCTDSTGGRVELDEEICLVVDGRAFIARCEMSLNNPMWRDTGRACVSSSLAGPLQSVKPAGNAGGIDTHIAGAEDKV
jgi:hypothetical protein